MVLNELSKSVKKSFVLVSAIAKRGSNSFGISTSNSDEIRWRITICDEKTIPESSKNFQTHPRRKGWSTAGGFQEFCSLTHHCEEGSSLQNCLTYSNFDFFFIYSINLIHFRSKRLIKDLNSIATFYRLAARFL